MFGDKDRGVELGQGWEVESPLQAVSGRSLWTEVEPFGERHGGQETKVKHCFLGALRDLGRRQLCSTSRR